MFHFARPSGYAPANHRQGYPTGYSPRSSFDTDYMVAQEEAAIRQRLADIETQRQQTYYNPGLQYRYEDSHEPSYGHQESRLAALRREVELEEQRYAAAARRQEEQALEAKLHATRQKRQALENATIPRPRAPPAIEIVLAEPQRVQHSLPRGCPRSSGPSTESYSCSRAHHSPQRGGTRTQETAPSSEPPFLDLLSSLIGGNLHQRPKESAFNNVLSQVLQAASSPTTKPHYPQPTRKTQPCAAASTSTEPQFFDLLSSLMGGNSQQPNVQEQIGTTVQDILSQILQSSVSSASKPKGQPSRQNPSSNASTSASSTEPPFLSILSSLMGGSPQQAGGQEQSGAGLQDILSQIAQSGSLSGSSQTSAQKQPEAESLQDFLGHMMQLGSQFSGHAQQQPRAQAGSSSSVPSTLKEELESRLYRDDSVENKDILEAIKASLQDVPAPVATPISIQVDSSSSSDAGKGKGKAESTPVSPTVAVTALDTIRNIGAVYTTLESEFAFPSTLDFTTSPSPSRNNSPHSSDSEVSSISRLAYTSRNQPVRYFEQSLSALVAQLDEIETLGNEELRSKRKELVDRIEKSMEDLESEIEGRWKSKARKDEKELKAREEKEREEREVAEALEASAREAEEQSAHGSEASLAASEATIRPYDVDSAPEPTSTSTPDSTPDSTADEAPATPNSEALDTFLLPADTDIAAKVEVKKSEKKDSDSDWSEVDA